MKTSKMALFIAAVMFAPSAFAYEITPYVGLGIVVDKANTSAKRVAFDSANLPVINLANLAGAFANLAGAFMPNAGNDMDFDMAFAGEITAGVKIDNVRLEAEVALRSASEDDYKIFDENIEISMGGSAPGSVNIPTEIETATKVRHNSYLFNMFYDFDLGTRWTPYVGAGIGFGVYHQKAIVEIDIEEDEFGIANAGNQIPGPIVDDMLAGLQQYEREMTVADDTLYRFEWQVSAGIAYNFNEDWALDLGYRFNSSTVGGEFVYAHEIKLGARYMF